MANRTDAGRRLADQLMHLRDSHPLVLELPRGGIPVAAEVAEALNAPLEPIFVKKIGAPGQEELTLGAVADGPNPQLVFNEEVMGRSTFSVHSVFHHFLLAYTDIAQGTVQAGPGRAGSSASPSP